MYDLTGNRAYNADCMELMREVPDKYFDLCVCDPPYGGGGSDDAEETFNVAICGRFGGRFQKDFKGEKMADDIRNCRGRFSKYKDNEIRHWDFRPPQEYFSELERVSKNRIIFGGNYFNLPPTRCFIIWRKTNIPTVGFTMAPVEYAWTSFNKNASIYEGTSARTENSGRFHPTEKPIDLYTWILTNYAKKGDKILDTHLGSGSSRIAAYELGLDFIGCEIDSEYFSKEEERFAAYTAQTSLFH